MAEWYYLDKRTRRGPFDEKQIVRMIKTGVIQRKTLVWNSGLPDWQEAVSTNLSAYFKNSPPKNKKSSPGNGIKALGSRIWAKARQLPQLFTVTGTATGSGAAVDNRFAWGIVGVTAVEIIVIYVFSWWLGLLLHVVLAFLAKKDVESIVASKGIATGQQILRNGTLWGLFMPPVYLWKRAAIVGDTKRLQFWAYCIVVIICILIANVAALLTFSYDPDIVAGVNRIIVENSLGDASCVSVVRIQKLSDTYSTYKAFMDNGKTIDINVTFTGRGKFYVEVPPADESYFRK